MHLFPALLARLFINVLSPRPRPRPCPCPCPRPCPGGVGVSGACKVAAHHKDQLVPEPLRVWVRERGGGGVCVRVRVRVRVGVWVWACGRVWACVGECAVLRGREQCAWITGAAVFRGGRNIVRRLDKRYIEG